MLSTEDVERAGLHRSPSVCLASSPSALRVPVVPPTPPDGVVCSGYLYKLKAKYLPLVCLYCVLCISYVCFMDNRSMNHPRAPIV